MNKVAVIIGANGAVGKKTCSRFANLGYTVFPATRDTDITKITSCDVLVCTAGKTTKDPLSTDVFRDMLESNLTCVYDIVEKMKSKMTKDSVIIFVSSVSAYKGGRNIGYAAAKAALESLCKNLALDLAPNIRVMSVAPSYIIDSPFATFDQKIIEDMKQKSPLKRLCTTDDVALAIESCVTHLTFSTGSTIFVDGGRLL